MEDITNMDLMEMDYENGHYCSSIASNAALGLLRLAATVIWWIIR
jgi:hypothetical protein